MRLPLKSPTVAAWLFLAAFTIIALLVVGGATRLTTSGLSITEWKPISGILPPGSDAGWAAEFANYKKIPQFAQINPHMTVDQFKGIYWWEWAHRLIARLLGVIYLLPFVFFLLMSEVPARVIWRSGVAIALILFQGLVGWWMVASGLSKRAFVAPEMLMFHLGMALLLLAWTLWTALEAGEGAPRSRGAPWGWRAGAGVLLGLVYFQCLLGALVAGNQAGLVYNDWPLMNGGVVPYTDWGQGIGMVLFHDQGVVQFMHRLNAYLLLVFAIVFAIRLAIRCQDDTVKGLAISVAVLACVQACLGIATLWTVVNFKK
ncbi:MAG: COX15/CtaA family protein [Asticcacaulis sp.]|nr:COX15/CtaA family protein [Asticcacaulis sp.]